jgi:putative transposase
MRRYLNFQPGDFYEIEGVLHVFKRCLPSATGLLNEPDLYRFETPTGRELTLTQRSLDELYFRGQFRRVPANEHIADRPIETFELDKADPQLGKRRIRQHLLRAFDAAPVSKSDAKLVEFIGATLATAPFQSDWTPSPGALRSWLRLRGEPGDRRLRHMGDRFARGWTGSRLSQVVQGVLAEKAEAYWENQQVTARDVWAQVTAALVLRDRSLGTTTDRPDPSTVWRYLKRELTYDRAATRYGARKAQELFQPLKGSLKADRILETAILDHTVVNCWVYDDERAIPLGRPTLTVLLDSASRYPLGFYLGFEPASLYAAMACIKRAVVPKLDLAERHPDVEGEWIAYGVPQTILADRGWEFVGPSFVDACEDAGIAVEWAPPRTPQYKGQGERLFRTLDDMLFHKAPGGVPLKAHLMKDAGFDPERDAALTLDELEGVIYQCVVEVYGREEHSTLKAAPEKVWRDREKRDGITIGDVATLRATLGITVSGAKLSRKGIRHNGLQYRSDAVFDLLQDLLPLQPMRGGPQGTAVVKIKVHPDELGSIDVWNDHTKRYVALPCVEAEYAAGLSAFHHEVLKEWTKKENLAFRTSDEKAMARVRLAATMNAVIPRRIRDRRRQQRLMPRPTTAQAVVTDVVGRAKAFEIETSTAPNRQDGRAVIKGKVRNRHQTPQVETRERDLSLPSQLRPVPPPVMTADDMIARIAAARRANRASQ